MTHALRKDLLILFTVQHGGKCPGEIPGLCFHESIGQHPVRRNDGTYFLMLHMSSHILHFRIKKTLTSYTNL
jgi:hypothetical protein